MVNVTGKGRHYSGDHERQHYGGTGDRFGHHSGQYVHAASQSRTDSKCGQVEECQYAVQFFLAQLVRIVLLPRQRVAQRVRLKQCEIQLIRLVQYNDDTKLRVRIGYVWKANEWSVRRSHRNENRGCEHEQNVDGCDATTL